MMMTDYSQSTAITPSPVVRQHNNWQNMTRTVAHYTRLEQIGEGTYGQVYRATCRDTGATVAMKKVRLLKSGYMGMPNQLIREIKILKRLQHPNLLRMIEVVTSKGVEHMDPDDPVTVNEKKRNKEKDHQEDQASIAREKYKGNLFLVLEYGTHDLMGLLDVAYEFTPIQVKCIFRQLLSALEYMHANKYVHRDIKSSNILLDSHFRLKLADFGLARSLEPPLTDQMEGIASAKDLTQKVITLWYRPPEILLGTVNYGCAVDVWSAGCILVELFTGKPLAAGKTDLEQLSLFADTTGTPDASTWNYLMGLKKDKKIEQSEIPVAAEEIRMGPQRPSILRKKYGPDSRKTRQIPEAALNLLDKLLEWDPRKRLTAGNALQNRYFWTQPVAPDDPAELGVMDIAEGGHFHEFQTKQKRRQAKQEAETAREQALSEGATTEEAKAVLDQTYQEIMKQVAQEGFAAMPAREDRPKMDIDEDKKDERKSRRDEKRSSSRHKSDDRKSGRSDRRGRDENRERKRHHGDTPEDERHQQKRRKDRGDENGSTGKDKKDRREKEKRRSSNEELKERKERKRRDEEAARLDGPEPNESGGKGERERERRPKSGHRSGSGSRKEKRRKSGRSGKGRDDRRGSRARERKREHRHERHDEPSPVSGREKDDRRRRDDGPPPDRFVPPPGPPLQHEMPPMRRDNNGPRPDFGPRPTSRDVGHYGPPRAPQGDFGGPPRNRGGHLSGDVAPSRRDRERGPPDGRDGHLSGDFAPSRRDRERGPPDDRDRYGPSRDGPPPRYGDRRSPGRLDQRGPPGQGRRDRDFPPQGYNRWSPGDDRGRRDGGPYRDEGRDRRPRDRDRR